MAELLSDPQPSDEQIENAARKYHFATDSVPLTPWEDVGLVRQLVCRTIAKDILTGSGLLQELVDLRKQVAELDESVALQYDELGRRAEQNRRMRGQVVVLETALRDRTQERNELVAAMRQAGWHWARSESKAGFDVLDAALEKVGPPWEATDAALAEGSSTPKPADEPCEHAPDGTCHTHGGTEDEPCAMQAARRAVVPAEEQKP